MKAEEWAKAYDPAEIEAKWYGHWEKQGYFQADAATPKTPFSMMIPPPNVTGSLHMGHAMYVVQDTLVRYHRMQAYNALWLPGTDHAGIATQLVVERMLQKEENLTRQDLGREAFVQRVWTWKEKYGNRIQEQLRVLGFSLDWSRNRFTMDEGLSLAVREAFVRLYEEGLIYRANRLINWCTRCYTALSDLEVEATETKGSLWHISYPVVDSKSQEHLVVATTRPETMLGDTAVAVHPEDPRFQHLIGKRVRVPLTERTIPVIADPILVSMEFGTGAVKVTPAHDFNDFETGQRHHLEVLSVFDLRGYLNQNVPEPFQGLAIADARHAVLAALQEQGLLVEEKPHVLSLGRCQRCDTIIEPMLSLQWFVKTTPLATPAIEAVEQGKTTFVPATYTEEYFRWMRNIKDWCISRQLWWGHRIPAWYDPADETKVYVARTAEEAYRLAGRTDLRQDDDVLDTWFSSALWPFSTLGWPQDTQELKTFYPSSVMETGHDILFFWVARMMMMGIHFLNKVPFRTVLLHALVVDENGEKMSKVKGNVLDPLHLVYGATVDEILGFSAEKPPTAKERSEALTKFKKAFPAAAAAYPNGFPRQGADALRFFLLVMGGQERNIRLSIPRVEGYRHFLNKMWSAARFFYMNNTHFQMDAFLDALRNRLDSLQLALPERWILSRLQQVIRAVNDDFGTYRLSEAAQRLYQFFWNDLCDWYIEMCKPHLQGASDYKQTVQGTLALVLETSMRLLHPMIPFITEEIWTRLPKASGVPESLMVTLYPSADEALFDEHAEQNMTFVQTAVSVLRSLKTQYQLTSPEVRFVIKATDENARAVLREHRDLIQALARTQVAEVVTEYMVAPGTLVHVADKQTILLPNAKEWIDFAAERTRLGKERGKLDQELASLQSRLQNPDFVARANPEVVEKSRMRIDELRKQIDELHRQQQTIDQMGS